MATSISDSNKLLKYSISWISSVKVKLHFSGWYIWKAVCSYEIVLWKNLESKSQDLII